MFYLARNKPYWLVLISGLMLAASFPPSPLWPLIFFAFVPLFVLLQTIPEKVFEDKVFFPLKVFFGLALQVLVLPLRVLYWAFAKYILKKPGFRILGVTRRIISSKAQFFRYFYLCFLIWNLLGCYWLSLTALGARDLEEALINFSSGFFAITLNPLLMFLPVLAFLHLRDRKKNPVFQLFILVCFWISFEFLHFRWDLSWSWMTLGHALTSAPQMIQYAEFTGVLGISAFILIANILVYGWVRELHLLRIKGIIVFGLSTVVWIFLPIILNPIILNPNRKIFQPTGTAKIKVVQPCIDPFQKFKLQTREDQMRIFEKLTQVPDLTGIDLVVFPETALPKYYVAAEMKNERMLQGLWSIIESSKVPVLTGISELRYFPDSAHAPVSAHISNDGRWYDHCNSSVVLGPNGPYGAYQKSKLVPLVERMPFLEYLTFLRDYNIDLGGGFSSYGLPEKVSPVKVNEKITVGMMICYESEFGDFVRRQTKQGANLLVVITNDGWWGNSSGYIQHAGLSVIRAIENRRCIARSANTGRSLFVDAKGQISHATKWWEETTIQKEVELYEAKTFFVQIGDWPGYLCLLVSLYLFVQFFYRTYFRKLKNETAIQSPTSPS